MDLDSRGKVSIRDLSNDSSDFLERLLESFIRLLALLHLLLHTLEVIETTDQ
jgi:hypothetical protein